MCCLHLTQLIVLASFDLQAARASPHLSLLLFVTDVVHTTGPSLLRRQHELPHHQQHQVQQCTGTSCTGGCRLPLQLLLLPLASRPCQPPCLPATLPACLPDVACRAPQHLTRCPSLCALPSPVQEHEQGSVQGALYGARALASGTGPLVFAGLFSVFTKTDSPLPYFPGAPFMFGTLLMVVAIGVAATIPSTAGGSGGSIERAGAAAAAAQGGDGGSSCEEEYSDGGAVKDAGGAAWPAKTKGGAGLGGAAAPSSPAAAAGASRSREGAATAADLEGGRRRSIGAGADHERSRLLG